MQSNAPQSPMLGDTWFDMDTHNTYLWTGAYWKLINEGVRLSFPKDEKTNDSGKKDCK
jgi:hypothetical protein